MFLSRHQNVGQSRDIKMTIKSFENVPEFKYFGKAVINYYMIQEEIERRLN
jgi:hypothetical protein